VSRKKKSASRDAAKAPETPRDGEPSPETDAAHPGAPARAERELGSQPQQVDITHVDPEATVNLTGEFELPGRDDLDEPTHNALPDSVDRALASRTMPAAAAADEPAAAESEAAEGEAPAMDATRRHLRGLIEALVFASDRPIKPNELAKTASAQTKEVKELLEDLKKDYEGRGFQLEEVAGGWIFRTNNVYAPFVRDLTGQRPVKLTRAQIETLAILAYRQPITRPEIDEIRGVDSGPVLKLLLERDLVRILGKKDEPGRPLLYGTTNHFLEFFGLKSVKDLPTLREFTELTEDSKRVVERELGETLESTQDAAIEADAAADSHAPSELHDTVAPPSVVVEEDAPGTDDPSPFDRVTDVMGEAVSSSDDGT